MSEDLVVLHCSPTMAGIKTASLFTCPVEDVDLCVAHMIYRVNASKDFPHEIGLFLGYPPKDVEAFIKNEAKNAKYVGTWKVYFDEENALKLFALYEKCTRVYQETYHKNAAFAPLVVRTGA